MPEVTRAATSRRPLSYSGDRTRRHSWRRLSAAGFRATRNSGEVGTVADSCYHGTTVWLRVLLFVREPNKTDAAQSIVYDVPVERGCEVDGSAYILPMERGPTLKTKFPRPKASRAYLDTSCRSVPSITWPLGEMTTYSPQCSASRGLAYRSYNRSPCRWRLVCSCAALMDWFAAGVC